MAVTSNLYKSELTRRLDDGSFEKTGVEFTDLVQYRKAAERAYEQFRKGDSFVAEGYTRDFDHTLEDGTTEPRQEFVAKKLGHDTARTTYTVDRAHHTGAGVDREQAPERGLAPFDPVASRGHIASRATSLAL